MGRARTPEAIPIRNVYFLLCYAWDQWSGGPPVEVGDMEGSSVVDLLALVLARGTARLLKQGLRQEYLRHQEELRGIRGKPLLTPTVSRGLLRRARTVSAFSELARDTPANRVLKSTLRELLYVGELDPAIRGEVREAAARFPPDIQTGPVRPSEISRIRIHRNNRTYGLLLGICRLIQENLQVSRSGRNSTFSDFRHDDAQMWRIFEGFLRGFLSREQDVYDVAAPTIDWYLARGTRPDLIRLPRMQSDMVLSGPDRLVILDAKFYKESFSGRFDRKSLHSGHLYQILAYVQNLAAADRAARQSKGKPARVVDGALVYPVVDGPFDLNYELLGHHIRACSVDLSREWTGVREEVLDLAGSQKAGGRGESESTGFP